MILSKCFSRPSSLFSWTRETFQDCRAFRTDVLAIVMTSFTPEDCAGLLFHNFHIINLLI